MSIFGVTGNVVKVDNLNFKSYNVGGWDGSIQLELRPLVIIINASYSSEPNTNFVLPNTAHEGIFWIVGKGYFRTRYNPSGYDPTFINSTELEATNGSAFKTTLSNDLKTLTYHNVSSYGTRTNIVIWGV